MQIQVSIRNPNRDHRAARVTDFTPERLHVRTDSISVQVAICVSSTPLNVFAAVSVPISVSIHLEGLGTNYTSRHWWTCTSLSASVDVSVSISVSVQLSGLGTKYHSKNHIPQGICMHVCMYAGMHVCMHVCMYV